MTVHLHLTMRLMLPCVNLSGDAPWCTVFIVSQRTSSIQHSDKIIVLDDGAIAGIGKHQEL